MKLIALADADSDALIARLTAQVETLQGEVARLQPWHDALMDAAVVEWVLSAANEHDPRKMINDLCCQAERIALDPAVSKPMHDLTERADAAEAQVETLQGERDEAVRRIPTEQPDRGGRLVLNAYGRACYDSGRERAEAQVTELQGLLNTATTLAATHFDRANAAEAQVYALKRTADDLAIELFDMRQRATSADAQVETLQGERDKQCTDYELLATDYRQLSADHAALKARRPTPENTLTVSDLDGFARRIALRTRESLEAEHPYWCHVPSFTEAVRAEALMILKTVVLHERGTEATDGTA